jgi:hypothetical protein
MSRIIDREPPPPVSVDDDVRGRGEQLIAQPRNTGFLTSLQNQYTGSQINLADKMPWECLPSKFPFFLLYSE